MSARAEVALRGLDDGRWTLVDTYEGEAVARAEPLDAIELTLATLWER